MISNKGGVDAKEFVEEKVAYVVDQAHPDKFNPRISISKTVDRIGRAKVEKTFRPFETDDIARVLDFEQVPDPPPDGPMMHCEVEEMDLAFPSRHFCLRGGFLFYFDLSDASGTGQSHYITYHGPPMGVIPLDKVKIEFPPGGRRVFREHAHTNARNGYELVILHEPDDETKEGRRPPAFVVAESLGNREKWASALRARAKMDQTTTMRAVAYTGDSSLFTKPQELLKEANDNKAQSREEATSVAVQTPAGKEKKAKGRSNRRTSTTGKKDKEGGDGDDNVIQEALQEFGKNNFLEKNWIDSYFETHNDFDAPARCRQMEQWQQAIKSGLKSAVLEQYEYFVEASGEMTTMGREVILLKTLVETQVETIKEMKEIDFASAVFKPMDDSGSYHEGDMFDQPTRMRKGRRMINASSDHGDDQSDASSVSSYGEKGGKGWAAAQGTTNKPKFRDPTKKDGAIELPDWFEDASEEIMAFVKESRYTDATNHWAKSKDEISEILLRHDEPTDVLLTKKQFTQVQTLKRSLDELAEMISGRLAEGLRRKNEALKQASKRERSDPLANMAPSVSPCCLNDDSAHLRLLIKLGKTHEAATAYSTRRSLLLLESLHERPISGTGSVDLVIYAAQLSQSFFSCLANSVEEFLDIFTPPPASAPQPNGFKEDFSLDESSIHSHSMRNLPAGALASIVLWCDAELTKFGAAFGGTRVLGNLALSPPPRDSPQKKGPRVLGQTEETNANRDRDAAVEVASQCVGQAFQYSSENLDTVGLPLSPRLAECIRSRLKGCEAEVAALLDEQWKPIVLDWETPMEYEDAPLDERRGN